jgi:hypothetical protein
MTVTITGHKFTFFAFLSISGKIQYNAPCTVVLKEGSGDIRELEWVVNRKTQVPRVKLPENDESGFRFWVRGTRETRRDPERFWFPKKPLF